MEAADTKDRGHPDDALHLQTNAVNLADIR